MSWQCFQLTYDLLSPLHVGYHKVGNVQRTRYYLPARNLWGAVTEKLTRSEFSIADASEGDYWQVGDWVKDNLAFTYFFPFDGRNLLYPMFGDEGLCYGGLKEYEFELCHISSNVTTALDASSTSAEPNSLHEVEFISPYCKANPCQGRHTQLQGWVFLSEAAIPVLGDKAKWKQWLGELQTGGERRYGYGRLRMNANGWSEAKGKILNIYDVIPDQLRPQVKLDRLEPLDEHKPVLLAHTITTNVQGKGSIEPLVGRETDTRNSQTFGQSLTRAKICWVPGTMLESGATFQIGREGIWEQVTS